MTNRLADETSPYLLQHKENPVDWWPWGPEAFAEAARRDVPILLSIGYAACLLSVIDLADEGVIGVADDLLLRRPRPLVADGALVVWVTGCSSG